MSVKIAKSDVIWAFMVGLLLCFAVFFDFIVYDKPFITETDSGLIYSYRHAAVNAIKHNGGIPLWNPLPMTGSTWIGQDVQANILHTVNVFLLIFQDPVKGYMAGIMTLYFASLFFAFLSFRWVFSFSIPVTILSTAIYGFNPEIHNNLEILFAMGVFLGMPLIILTSWAFVKTEKFYFILLSVLATAFCYYSSTILNLQVLFMLAAISYFLFIYQKYGEMKWKYFLKAYTSYLLLTVCLCAPILFPSIFNAFISTRSRLGVSSIDFTILPNWFSGQVGSIVNFLTIRHFSDIHHVQSYLNKFVGSYLVLPAYYYCSILAIFALIGHRVLKNKKNFIILLTFLLFPVVMGVMQGLPLISSVFHKVTGGHGYVRFLRISMLFASAGLAGLIIDECRQYNFEFKGLERKISKILVGTVLLLIVGVNMTFQVISKVLEHFSAEILKFVQNGEVIGILREILTEKFSFGLAQFDAENISLVIGNIGHFFSSGFGNFLIVSSLIKILLLCFMFFYLCGRSKSRWIFSVLIILGVLDVYANQRFMGGGNNLIREHVYDQSSGEHKFLSSLNLENRTAVYYPESSQLQRRRDTTSSEFTFPHPNRFFPLVYNFQMPYLVPSYSTYLSVMPKGLAQLHENISTSGAQDREFFLGKWMDSEVYLYNTDSGLVDYIGIDYIFSPVKLKKTKLQFLEKGKHYWIYKNLRSKGRFDFVPYGSADVKLERITYGISDGNAGRTSNYAISDKVFSFDHVSANINVNEKGFLVLKDSFDPWWKVFVDGKEGKVLVANDLFRGVLLNPGRHIVEFKYVPKIFYFGLLVFGIGIVCMLGLYVADRRSRDILGFRNSL